MLTTRLERGLALVVPLAFLVLAACPAETPTPGACAATETACGDSCCAEGETCDAATSTCEAPTGCAEGETACGDSCCAEGETCDAATSTCEAPAGCAEGETACGDSCCAEGETCDAATSTCEAPDEPDRLAACYAPAAFASTAFASDPRFLADADGYEYTANHAVDEGYAQMLSVALWPLSDETPLTGTFDLADEPVSYAECERCVLVIAGRSAEDEKHYLATGGTLSVAAVSRGGIEASLEDAQLVEVRIDPDSLATETVTGGCTLEIPTLAIAYGDPNDVPDPRLAECFLPESFGPGAFRDYVLAYESNAYGSFYRAMELPDTNDTPHLQLFIEVYEDGIGTYPLANSSGHGHLVIIEAKTVSGDQKDYVSFEGNLVLTEHTETAMEGRLENVRLEETVISDLGFDRVEGGCTTFIESLEFSSRNAD